MVAVVSGNGLGLFNTSANILGGMGMLGQGMLGQAGGRSYVNAATGNLLLQFQDEALSGRGADLFQLRTYNSLGSWNDGDADGWRWDGERKVVLSGTANTTGSTVTRTAADGHETTYTFVSSTIGYTSAEGSGAHDSIKLVGAQWVWTEGTTRLEERYTASTGLIASQKDTSGNQIDYAFTSGRLTSITDHGSGQKFELVYTTVGPIKLHQVNTREVNSDGSISAPIKQVEYAYDSGGRLISVSTDLTPQTTGDNLVYTTSYTYKDATSHLIASVSQSDGTSVSFVYYDDGRVKQVKDASGAILQSFAYISATQTDITDGNGQVWSYVYDSTTKQLTQIKSPPPVAGAAPLVTTFHYDASGNVDVITDARNNAVTYKYDAQGNRTRERDAEGNTVSRTFDANNQVLTETRYRSVDANGNDEVLPSDPMTARLVYDTQSRLRFTVSAEGRVTEYRYNTDSFGLLARSISYAADRYTLSTASEADLTAWVAGQDKSKVQQSTYAYDPRGNLSRRIDFSTVNSAGEGVLATDAAATVTDYSYSARGELLQTIAVRGAARNVSTTLSSYTYDGLGRETSRLDSGGHRATSYDGSNRTIQVTNSDSGLIELRSFDSTGRLISVSQSAAGSSGSDRTTQYTYDAANQLRMVQDAQGGRRFSFYDAAGRLQYQVDSLGAVIGFEYNADGQLTTQTAYAKPVLATAMNGWVSGASVTKTTLTVGAAGSSDVVADSHDRVTRYDYDKAGRLTTRTDAANITSTTTYDGASRTTVQQTGERLTRFFYDRDGRQIGVVDPLGYLTESKFDAAGRLIETVRYTNRSSTATATNISAPVWVGADNQSFLQGVNAERTFVHFVPAFDPDGEKLTFTLATGTSLPAWLSADLTGTTGVTLKGNPPASVSSYSVTLVATDARGRATSTTIAIGVTIDNHGPSWTPVPTQQAFVGEVFNLTVPAAVDPEGQTLTYSVIQKPSWLTFNTTMLVLSGTPPSGTSGAQTVVLQARDPLGETTTLTFTVTVKANTAPTWTSLPPATAFLGFFFDYTPPAATDADGDALTYSVVSGLPAGLAMIDPATGHILGIASGSEGDFSVVLRATDTHGASVTRTLALHVGVFGFGLSAPALGAPAALGSIAPLDDVLASWRPTDTAGLHTYRYYDAEGRVVGSVDERGFLSEFIYDEQLHTQRSVQYLNFVTVGSSDTLDTAKALAGSSKETAKLEYDTLGRVSKSTAVDGTVTRNEYDSAGRMVREVRADGLAEQRSSRMRYDAFGEVTGSVGGVGDAAGLSTDEAIAQYGVRYEFDKLGRRTRSITRDVPGNDVITLAYYDSESRLTHTVNARGEVNETVYDSFGQVKEQRGYGTRLPNTDEEPFLAQLQAGTKGLADLAAKLVTIAPNNTRITRYEYDQRGLLAKTTDAEGFVTNNSYTAFGELATQVRTILQAAAATTATTVTTNFGYDVRGALVSQTGDAGGINFNQQTSYDAFGRVTDSLDAAGKVTHTDYLDSGRTIEVTDPLNRKIHTEYDAFTRVLKQVDARGKATTFVYDDVARSISITTPEGITVVTLKTRFGETLSVTDGSGRKTAYEYNQDGQLTRVTDALNQVITENLYEKNSLLKQTTDHGVLTTFRYDAIGRLFVRTVDPAGLNLKCTYQVNGFGQQIRAIESGGKDDVVVRHTIYNYDSNGRLTRVVVDPDALKLATFYSYDGLGDTLQVAQGTLDDPNQLVTQYVFDRLGRRVKQIVAPSAVFGTQSANTRDLTTQYRYDAAGNLSRSLDAKGQSTWYVHDAARQLTYTVNAAGEITQNFYDANGRVTGTIRYAKAVAPGTLAGFGDVVNTLTATPNQFDQRSYAVYDDDGRPRYTLVNTIGANWTVRESRYDSSGNVIETRTYDKPLADTRVTAIAANGITPAEVAAELLAIKYDDSKPASLVNVRRTRFAYDADNQLRFTIDSLGAVSESTYDAAGRVIASIRYAKVPILAAGDYADSIAIDGKLDHANPDNQVTHFAYDAAGRLRYTVRVLAEDKQFLSEQRCDALGRVVETIAYSTALSNLGGDYSAAALTAKIVASASDRRAAFIFDAAGHEAYRAQMLVNAQGETRYVVSKQAYDALGHVVQSTAYATAIALDNFDKATLDAAVVTSSQDRTTQYAYDKAGRARFVVTPDGVLSETVYDALGQVAETRQFDLTVGTSAIDEATLATLRGSRAVGDGVTRGLRFTYDKVGRVLTSTDAKNAVETSTYDALGNRKTLKNRNNDTWTYSYDRLGRLTNQSILVRLSGDESQPATTVETEVKYDAFGNLTSRTEAKGLAEERTTSYGYDALGRQIKVTQPGWYDPASGKVESVSATGRFQRTIEFSFDALGNVVRNRVRTSLSGSSDLYEYKTYDTLGRIVHDVDVLHHVTAFAYNSFDEQATVTRYAVDIGAPTAADGLWKASEVAAKVAGDALARTVTTSYDNLGRKTQVTQPATSRYYWATTNPGMNQPSVTALSTASITKYEYNNFGELRHESLKVDDRHDLEHPEVDGTWRDTWHYFDVMGREIVTVDALGFQTARSFDALGNLTQVTEYANAGDSGNGVTPPAIPSLSFLKDRITVFGYNALNQQTTIKRMGLSYSSWNGSSYDQINNSRDVATTVATVVYDGMGNVVSRTDGLGNLTSMQYNALGQVIEVTDPARSAAAAGSTDPFLNQKMLSPETRLTLNAFGQVVRQERITGETPYASESKDHMRITLQQYDAGGNLIRSTDANYAGAAVVNHDYDKVRQYDYAGRVIKETQLVSAALGTWQSVTHTLERRYAYDASGHQTDVLDVYVSNGASLQSGARSVYNAFGEVKEERKTWGAAGMALGALNSALVASYVFDNTGRVITKTAGDGVTQYFYNLAGQVTRQEQQGNNSSSDGTGTRITEIGYDVLGRATIKRLPSFAALLPGTTSAPQTITQQVEQVFDRWGNVTSSSQGRFYQHSTAGVVSTQERTTTYDYNADNKVIAEHLAQVSATRANGTTYQVNVTHVLHYDLLGRSVEELELADDAGTAGVETTQLRAHPRVNVYNNAGQLVSKTDATNITTKYAYDGFGNRVGTGMTSTALGGALVSVFVDAFDKNGNLTSHSLLRLADGTSAYVSGSGQTPVARVLNFYGYDQANRRVSSSDVIDAAQTTIYTAYVQYDERNLVRAQRTPDFLILTDIGIVTRYDYDEFGNKISAVTDNDGDTSNDTAKTQTWTYSHALSDYSVNRLVSTTVGGNRTTGYFYNDFGQISTETYPGVNNSRVYTYQDNGMLKQTVDNLTFGIRGAGGGADYWQATDTMRYEYTVNGERASESYTRSGEQEVLDHELGLMLLGMHTRRDTQITYDALGRVASVSAPALNPNGTANPNGNSLSLLTYQYDELGNRRHIHADYHRSDSNLTASDQWYTYDDEGRMTLADGTLQGTQIKAGQASTRITYDSLGRRATAESFIRHHQYLGTADDATVHDWDEFREERYTYDDMNLLTKVEQRLNRRNGTAHLPGQPPHDVQDLIKDNGWSLSAMRFYDTRGAVTTAMAYDDVHATGAETESTPELATTTTTQYRADGQVAFQFINDARNNENDVQITNHYDGDGLLHDYTYRQGGNTNKEFTNTYQYHYTLEFGGTKEKSIDVSFSKPATSDAPDPQGGKTTDEYDSRGQLVRQSILNATQAHTRSFSYDSEGHIITKTDDLRVVGQAIQTGEQEFFYANGHGLAILGSDTLGIAQFSNNFTPISASYPGTSPGAYTVNANDTLAGIAGKVFGDASLWYLIADANNIGFGPTDALPSTELGKTYRIPNLVSNHNNADTFKPYNLAEIIGNSKPSPSVPHPPTAECGVVGTVVAKVVILAIVAVVTVYTGGALSGALGPVVAGAIGGAAGSVAGQGVGIGLGVQKDFSGKQVAGAAIAGGFAGVASAAEGQAASNALMNPSTGELESIFTFGGGFNNAFANMAQSYLLSTIGKGLAGVSSDPTTSLIGLGTEMVVHGLLGDVFAAADTKNFAFGNALEQITANAVNPQTGWLFNERSRDWASIAGQAAEALGGVVVGGVIAWAKEPRKQQGGAQPQGGLGKFSLQGTLFEADGGAKVADDRTTGSYEIVDGHRRKVSMNTNDEQAYNEMAAAERGEWVGKVKTWWVGYQDWESARLRKGEKTEAELQQLRSELPEDVRKVVMPSPEETKQAESQALAPAPDPVLAPALPYFTGPQSVATPEAPEGSKGGAFKGATIEARPSTLELAVSGDAWQFTRVTNSNQMKDVMRTLVEGQRRIEVIHVSVGAHGSPTGGTFADPRVLGWDRSAIDAFRRDFPQTIVWTYDLADPVQAARFYEVQALTANGELPGQASIHSPCFSAACTPTDSPAYFPEAEDNSTGDRWREADDVVPADEFRDEPTVNERRPKGMAPVQPGETAEGSVGRALKPFGSVALEGFNALGVIGLFKGISEQLINGHPGQAAGLVGFTVGSSVLQKGLTLAKVSPGLGTALQLSVGGLIDFYSNRQDLLLDTGHSVDNLIGGEGGSDHPVLGAFVYSGYTTGRVMGRSAVAAAKDSVHVLSAFANGNTGAAYVPGYLH